MKKPGIVAIAALALTLLMSGCNELMRYSLSEQEVNAYLQKHNDYRKQIGIPGVVDATIVLTELTSQIGRAEPGKVTLSGHAKVDINSLLGAQSADLQLTLKAQPVFDKTQGAIFLREMELVDYRVTPEKMEAVMKTLSPYLNQSLRSYFDQKPIYVLSEDNSKLEALAKKMAKGIDIKPGQITLLLTD